LPLRSARDPLPGEQRSHVPRESYVQSLCHISNYD
jgi:hypothetical protein